jgi:hypothetical protein
LNAPSLVEPTYPDLLYHLAALCIQLDRYRDAVPLLERYIRLDPTSTWAHEGRKLLLACRTVLARIRSDLPAGRTLVQ